MKISILYIGKPRNPSANRMAEDYVERSGRYTRAEMREVRNPEKVEWDKHASALKVCLDPSGKALDSRAFADLIRSAEMKSRDLLFLIGGADGLPEAWRARADLALSISAMTLPHELARVVLAEQVYRAFATLRGHPYAR